MKISQDSVLDWQNISVPFKLCFSLKLCFIFLFSQHFRLATPPLLLSVTGDCKSNLLKWPYWLKRPLESHFEISFDRSKPFTYSSRNTSCPQIFDHDWNKWRHRTQRDRVTQNLCLELSPKTSLSRSERSSWSRNL